MNEQPWPAPDPAQTAEHISHQMVRILLTECALKYGYYGEAPR